MSSRSRYRRAKYVRRPTRAYVRGLPPPSQLTWNSGWRPLSTGYKARLRYCTPLALNCSVGTTVAYVFSANGLYDPDITGSGHQPYGFDQLMAMYNHYTVISSKCQVRWYNNTNFPVNCGIALRDDSSGVNGTAISQILETPGTVSRMLGASASQDSAGAVSKGFSCRRFFTRRTPIIEDANLRGTAAANPTEQAYFHVFATPNLDTDDPPQITGTVVIDFIAWFTEPKILAQS